MTGQQPISDLRERARRRQRHYPLQDDGSLVMILAEARLLRIPCAAPYRWGDTLIACGTTLYEALLTPAGRSGYDLKRCPDCGFWNIVHWHGCIVRIVASRERGTTNAP